MPQDMLNLILHKRCSRVTDIVPLNEVKAVVVLRCDYADLLLHTSKRRARCDLFNWQLYYACLF